jgi:hypothetical protein
MFIFLRFCCTLQFTNWCIKTCFHCDVLIYCCCCSFPTIHGDGRTYFSRGFYHTAWICQKQLVDGALTTIEPYELTYMSHVQNGNMRHRTKCKSHLCCQCSNEATTKTQKKQRHMKGKTIKQTRYTKAHEHKVSVCREALPWLDQTGCLC